MALSAALAGSLADAWSWLEFLACHEKQVIKRVIVSPVYALLALGSFFVSLRTRYSKGVVVRIQDVGFFSNYLAVLDACARVPPGATVAVDWRLSGSVRVGPGATIKPYVVHTTFRVRDGLVVFQEDEFSIPGWQILLGVLLPGLPIPEAAPPVEELRRRAGT